MKILGIGVDIIQNKRIKYLIKNENFHQKWKETNHNS